MKTAEIKETFICDICKKELTSLEYENSAKMTVTLSIPSKKGKCPGYAGVGNIDVCEECVVKFGFVYDDPYIGDHLRRVKRLKDLYSNIIDKAKLKLKFNAIK